MSFGKNINKLRKKAGYSQEELGDKIGVTRQTISKWELEQTSPSLSDINKIAQVFSVKIDDLIKDEKDNNSNTEETVLKKNNKYSKVIFILLLITFLFLILICIYRFYVIFNVKLWLDKAASFDNDNYFIEEIISQDGKIVENDKMYFYKEKIKYVKGNLLNNFEIDSYEIIDDEFYYFVDNKDKKYSIIESEEYYQKQMDYDTILVKDMVINNIYKDIFSLKNNYYLKLICMFNVNVKIGNGEEFIIEYKDRMISVNKNDKKIQFNKFDFDSIRSYTVELDCVEESNFEFNVEENYTKVDI